MSQMSHYHFNETVTIEYQVMQKWVTDIFNAQGISHSDSEVIADSLVDADARGVYSHGTQRIRMYTNRIQKDCVNVHGKPYVAVDADATAVVDGENAMGQVVGSFAMKLAMEKAKKYGVSFVVVRNSNHYGRCAYYSRMAMEENMIGISASIGGGNLMAPYGGAEPRVGNNPFSIAMPTQDEYPVVLDMAQSVVAKGKIEMAVKTGSPIPAEWALDKYGNPTTDAKAGSEGSVRAIAEYKGSGIAVMVGLLCSVISNGAIGSTLKNVYKDFDGGLNKGQLFAAVDIGRMSDVDAYKERMDEQVRFIKDTPRAKGMEDVYLPGELEWRNHARQTEQGITYAIEVIREIEQISRELGVEIPAARQE